MKKHSILIVDDNDDFRELLTDFFQAYGFETIQAENGNIAYQVFLSKPIDCIISDVTMPECNGIDLARKIFHHEKPVPLALISGYTDHVNFEDLKHSKYWIGFFSKPFNENQLVETIIKKIKTGPLGC